VGSICKVIPRRSNGTKDLAHLKQVDGRFLCVPWCCCSVGGTSRVSCIVGYCWCVFLSRFFEAIQTFHFFVVFIVRLLGLLVTYHMICSQMHNETAGSKHDTSDGVTQELHTR
jgi:hypothetical protein